jgi:hypothetical protein
MAATSKPVRRMRKEGKEPSKENHSPTGKQKKTERILKKHTQQVRKHIHSRMEGKGGEGKKTMEMASALEKKLPKTARKSHPGKHLRRQAKGY